MRKLIAAFAFAVALPACGGGSSPTAPAPGPTATPTPAPLTFTFTPQTPTPPNFTISVSRLALTNPAGQIVIQIDANELRNVCKVRGTLRWDPRVLEPATATRFGEGPWFKQGGALVDWTHFFLTGSVDLFLDRPSSQGCVSGSGPIFYVFLQPVGTLRAGASQLQWDGPRVYDANFREQKLDNAFGGEIKFQ